MRRPIVAGNWKMNGTLARGMELATAVRDGLGRAAAEVVLCPPFTSLQAVGERLSGSAIRLGAQNLHYEAEGAFTGEIAAGMLRDLGCAYVIVGHSERRTHFGETDRDVGRKARAALAAGIRPILCIGETLEERERGRTDEILTRQLEQALAGIGQGLRSTVLAYEPVWAIGTGKTATVDQVQAAHAHIRGTLARLCGVEVAGAVRIQYGGSLKPENARDIFARPDVDGGLVGGASLDARSFLEIVVAADTAA